MSESIIYGGQLRTAEGVATQREYVRLRQRARRAVATAHRDEVRTRLRKEASEVARNRGWFNRAKDKSRREVANRYPDEIKAEIDRLRNL